uniref:Uncharacterized protein n=1 Tax=Arundo donax TaxID=35708 RepID=A0A0A9CX78_ARUDO
MGNWSARPGTAAPFAIFCKQAKMKYSINVHKFGCVGS